MKKQFYLTIIIGLFTLSSTNCIAQWGIVSTDPPGDGTNPAVLDGVEFDYLYDQTTDSLWFRVVVDTLTPSMQGTFGVNVMVNIPGAGNTFNFWGADNQNPFHRLLTTWVTGTPPSTYTGTIGIANATGVGANAYTNLSSNNISITMDVLTESIILGLKRSDLIPDTSFGAGDTLTVAVQAAVGSNTLWNDDIYDSAATMTIIRNTTGIKPVAKSPEIKIFLNSSTKMLNIDFGSVDNQDTKISITSVTGSIVRKIENVNSSVYTANVSDLAKGVYIISVTKNENVIAKKKIVLE